MYKPPGTAGVKSFTEMVDAREKITLGAAKQHAASLPEEQRRADCGCFKVRCIQCCGPNCVAGVSCFVPCGCCLWTPSCYYGLDLLIGMLMGCNCPEGSNTGTYSCTDLKGNKFSLVKVDGDKGVYAWFSENEWATSHGDTLENAVYCEKCC